MKSLLRPRLLVHSSLAAAIAAAALSGVPQTAEAKKKHVGEAIAAGVIGLAIGAALSHKQKHNEQVYYPGYQPYYPDGGYDDYYRRSFSPAPGVICYEAQRACYDPDGTFSNRWMRRIYGS